MTTLPMPATRLPAWQRLGKGVSVNPDSAIDGFEGLGAYPVELVPVYTGDPEDPMAYASIEKRQAIQRLDTGEVFDIVGSGYTILEPHRFAMLLDEHVDLPLEGFAHLKGGRKQLAIYKLPDFEVAGDAMGSSLIVINEMSGKRAVRAMIGDVRMICTNGQVSYDTNGGGILVHDHRLSDRFVEWISWLPKQAETKAAVMRDVYEVLAKTPIESGPHQSPAPPAWQPQLLINHIYPMPKAPVTFGPRAEVEANEARYEIAKKRIITLRGEALALYQGAGTGLDTPATEGTAWGLLQAIMELEEYRPGRLVAESNLIGDRQATKRRAFEVITSAIGVN